MTLNTGFWSPSEKKIYSKHIIRIMRRDISFKQLASIIKTRDRTQVRSHHQKNYNEIRKISKILLDIKYSINY